MSTTQRVQSMNYTHADGSTVTIDHVAGKGFRARTSRYGTVRGMSARGLAAYTRNLRDSGFTMVEAV
jgi:hypothetical protein